MSKTRDIYIEGVPNDVPETEAAILRSRLCRDINAFMDQTRCEDVRIKIFVVGECDEGKSSLVNALLGDQNQRRNSDEKSLEERASQYTVQKPLYNFDDLVLSEAVMDNLLSAVDAIAVESIVYKNWGLNKIQPNPHIVLNFYGSPGTGKTLAAHAIAHRLEKQILLASYADIESKFHGDGPKNLKAIFHAAEQSNAVLFIDEADSLLSKRLTEVTSGSEQAINSMRSQLLICLEQFRGIVIFATNLVENYDKAFETRVRHIYFPMPDEECRREIWRHHLPKQLPLAADVSVEKLAQIEDVCGREIREAVIDAAVRAALQMKKQGKHPTEGVVNLKDLLDAIERKKTERITLSTYKLNQNEEEIVRQKVQAGLCR
ncbi:ATP-binding protein [Microseira wollei]|uniref:AAA family ATPase n=1 Tax=Microseira wollei NIES-4236 TaxID=2530354 RepID=A0AAV3XCB0_9CYAN|nr:ATP-binding protein [Microseira wollei]GET39843.1 putative AAA family ATPase [Microseira wollei NIES-4236]